MGARARVPLTFEDGYLPLSDLATYSGLSVRTLRDHLTNGDHPLPHYKVDGRIVVKRSEYDAWVQKFHRTAATPEAELARQILASMR